MPRILLFLALFGMFLGSVPANSFAATAQIKLGIDVLADRNVDLLQGKRVGMLTHSAAVNSRGMSDAEVLAKAPGVNVVALFAPEHGFDGELKAEENVNDTTHAATGLPVRSVYGETRKPTPKMLSDINLMVIDLQDIGVRSYTYASAMKYTIEACFERHIPVVVLDRPNPLGGLKVDGPILDPKWRSYVGATEIPYIHGLTIGELAKLDADEIRPIRGSLTVVAMEGWRRYMIWPDTGLKWTPTSPAIPNVAAAFGYSFAGIGAQLGGFRHGYNTEYPFRFLSHPKISAQELCAKLRAAQIPGFRFVVTTDKKGQEGVYVLISDWNKAGVIELSLTMLKISQELNGVAPFAGASANKKDLFNKHWGRDEPLNTLSVRPLNAHSLANYWRVQAQQWQRDVAMRYWMYR